VHGRPPGDEIRGLDAPVRWLDLLTLSGWLGAVLVAGILRGRRTAARFALRVGLYSLVALAVAPLAARVLPLFVALHVVAYVHFAGRARPRMRSLAYRLLVSFPAAFFVAGTVLALPWAVAAALGFHPWAAWLPYALSAAGLAQSLWTREEEINLVIGGPSRPARLAPFPRGPERVERPLRIVQITDPHLGPFMSVARLRRIADRTVARDPDLVFLTGDFLTMESEVDPEILTRALEPLRALPGKVFACRGNHDLEAPEIVTRALAEIGATLLVDDERLVSTEAGPIQIVGVDFVWRGREAHLERVCRDHPRKDGAMRIVLLHDPGAFRHLPEGEGDLVLSGHTHGGQVGLVSLGLSWTFLRLFGVKVPDHGFWARGRDRLYVHRGTGHYGFPLRLGVPSEESLVRVHRLAEGDAGTDPGAPGS
jgi:predicted MPP superfamily phosphohydrolase